jgi:hypothetical protein
LSSIEWLWVLEVLQVLVVHDDFYWFLSVFQPMAPVLEGLDNGESFITDAIILFLLDSCFWRR